MKAQLKKSEQLFQTPFESVFGFEMSEDFCSGVFSDELDQLGLKQQVVAGYQLNNPNLRGFGPIRTIKLETVETDDERIDLGLGFLDTLNPGDFLVVEGSSKFAYFGELMTRLSIRAGLSGVAIDGLTRDSYFTQKATLPVFAQGYSPVDIKGRGRVQAVDVSVRFGGLSVSPGDYIYGDNDALVFVPKGCVQDLRPRIAAGEKEEARIKDLIRQNVGISDILKQVKSF